MSLLRGTLPVVVGVFMAGWILNALRAVGPIRQAIRGFDHEPDLPLGARIDPPAPKPVPPELPREDDPFFGGIGS